MSKKSVSQSEVQIAVVETSQPEVQVAKPKVGERARQLILEGTLDNKGILEQIKKEYPEAKTSIACIAWYKSDLKKSKAKNDEPFIQWKKANGFDDATLRAKFEAQAQAVTA